MTAGDTPAARTAGLLAGGIASTVAGLGLGTAPLVVLGAGLVALTALCWLGVWSVARGLRVERVIVPDRCTAGEWLDARCRPDGWPVRMGGLHRLFEVGIDPRLGSLCADRRPERVAAGRWRVGPVPRGDHELGPPVVRVRDPLGIAVRTRRAPWGGTGRIWATPYAPAIVRLDVCERALDGRGGMPRPVRGAGELDRVREHRAGDPLGRIHWGHTARRGRLHTKELRAHEAVDGGVEVILDGAVAPGADFELAVTAAATTARHLRSRGRAVAVTHTGGRPAHLPGARSTWSAIESILTLARPGTDTPAADAVGAAACRPDRPALVVVVSAGPTPALADALSRARAGGIAVAAILAHGADGPAAEAVARVAPAVHVTGRAATVEELEGRVARPERVARAG